MGWLWVGPLENAIECEHFQKYNIDALFVYS